MADTAIVSARSTTVHANLRREAERLAQETDLVGGRAAPRTEIKKAWHFNSLNGPVVLVPVVSRYADLVNGLCRLMVQKDAGSRFVTTPVESGSDNCKDIERILYLDLNQDGYPDVVLNTVVPSNRYASDISLPQIYISNPQGDYCYAGLASRALTSEWDGKAKSARQILNVESARLGVNLMQCTAR